MKLSRYSIWLATAVAVVFGGVIALHWPNDDRSAPVDVPASERAVLPPSSTQVMAAKKTAPEAVPALAHDVAAQPDPPRRHESEYQARLQAATDYLAFARDVLGRARDGDPDAQYHLYAALDYCRRSYLEYFDRGQKRHSLDEALRLQGDSPTAIREIRQVHSRCGNLMSLSTGEFGEGEQWLQRSARSGHPRAQVKLASRLISGSRMLAPAQASRSLAEARAFVRQSLASRDPGVIWAAATLPAASADAGARDRAETMAWWQAACDQGLECGPGSDQVRQLCREVPDCQPFESVNDILVRTSRNPSAVTERAKQISASIANGEFESLGL